MKLAGRIALVTGGQQGIGAAIAVALAEAGRSRGLLADAEPAANRLQLASARGRRVHLVRADMARLSDIESMVADTVKCLAR
jgi:NAD(P)-dependent dehydrogenase (short-subunit alcohol dehydrogenase family)